MPKISKDPGQRFFCNPHSRYGVLGWIESVIKILAFLVALASFSEIPPPGKTRIISSPQIGLFVLFPVLILAYFGLAVHRFIDGELTGVAFAISHIVAHIIITAMLFVAIDLGEFVFSYAILMFFGEWVKLIWLMVKYNTEALDDIKLLKKEHLVIISLVFGVFYSVILVLQLVLWVGGFYSKGNTGL